MHFDCTCPDCAPDLPSLDEIRFWRKVHKTDTCWLWLGRVSATYGVFDAVGREVKAHRFAYENWHKSCILPGYFVCHTCDVRLCCRPDHLWLGTTAENVRDMVAKGRNHIVGGDAHWTRLNPRRMAEVVLRGEASSNAKITDDIVRAIRNRAAGGEQQRALGREYGIGEAQVSRIVHRRRWAHLD